MRNGRAVTRTELQGKAPHEVAALLGHDLSGGGGVSIEPDRVVVHTPGKRAPLRVEHLIVEG